MVERELKKFLPFRLRAKSLSAFCDIGDVKHRLGQHDTRPAMPCVFDVWWGVYSAR